MSHTKVIVYGLDPLTAHGEKVKRTLESLGAELVYVDPKNLMSQMGALAGLEGYELIEHDPITDLPQIDYLLFVTNDANDLDPFMHAMKINNAQVGAKGTLTDQNKDWPFLELVKHVADEHATMEKFFELHALSQEIGRYLEMIKERNEADPEHAIRFPTELSDALYLAKDNFVPDKEPEIHDLTAALKDLREAYYRHNGRREFTEPVTIVAEKNETTTPVSYDLTVSVEGHPAEAFQFRWNDGARGPKRTEIPASELARLSVTVYAIGELHGVRKDVSLQVPAAPKECVATLDGDAVKLQWQPSDKDVANCPELLAYLVRFDYPDATSNYFEVPGNLTSLKIGFQDAQALRPSGYHVAAVNIVGRSDFTTARIRD